MLRFHLDENVDHAVARGLQARGLDVTTSTDAKLVSADDPSQLAFALSEKRVLITHDGPLLGLAGRTPHAGIAYCAVEILSVGEIVRYAVLMSECLSGEQMMGQIEFMR